MKKLLFISAAAVLLAVQADNTFAGARNPSNRGLDYVVGSSDLADWSFGVYADQWTRNLRLDGSRATTRVKNIRYMALLGYDVLPQVNAYLTAGQNATKFGYDDYEDAKWAGGAGLQFNLIDVEIADPGLLEDKLRLDAALEGLYSQSEYRGETLSWSELYADLTLGLVNDAFGFSFLAPESIALFTGPFYLGLFGSDFDGPGENQYALGWTVGGEIFVTKRVSLHGRYNFADDNGFTAGVNVRF